jgi:hypothetical protein
LRQQSSASAGTYLVYLAQKKIMIGYYSKMEARGMRRSYRFLL